MNRISKKNRKIIKTQFRSKHARYTHKNTQYGGVKVIIGMGTQEPTVAKPIEREVTDIASFTQILNAAIDLEVISSSSLNSFVIKLQLPSTSEFFKSDILGEDGKKLDFIQIMDATSGRLITEIIIKICIIGYLVKPPYYNFDKTHNPRNKSCINITEFDNEYETQRYLYSAMMSESGNPFCADAFGKLRLNTAADFTSLFNTIKSRINQQNEFHYIHAYLIDLLKKNFSIGLIMMESFPGNYNLLTNFLPGKSMFNPQTYQDISEIICAINIITIYRGKLFLLDGHPNNWLCDAFLPTLSKVKAIDFGRVYRLHNAESIEQLLTNVKSNVVAYFRRISCLPGQTPQLINKTVSNFLTMLCISAQIQSAIMIRYPLLEHLVIEAANLLVANLREIIDTFQGDILFSKPFSDITPEERHKSINMIHRLLLTLSIVDGFFNDTKFKDTEDMRRSQQYESYKRLYNTDVSTPELIIASGMLMDFNSMNGTARHTSLSKTYEKVYTIVHHFCKDNRFPDIRGYSAFKKVERAISDRAVIKLTPHARVVGNKLWDACNVVGDALGRIGMETAPFLEEHVMHPIFDRLVYNPTMWMAYKLRLAQRPPPPPKIRARSAE